MDRPRLVVLTASATVLASLVAACGSYDNTAKGTGGTGGSMTAGGTGGTAAGSGGVGTGGTGGTTGGAAGAAAGSGGSSGQAGNGAGGTPTGGASGSGAGGSGAGAGGASGGGAGPMVCADAAPCGGDLTGTWSTAGCDMTVSGMATFTTAGIGCASAPVEGSMKLAGTFTATADGMFTDNTTTTGELVMELAAQCLMISGTMGAGCDRLDLAGAGFPGGACVSNPETMGCTCTFPIDQMAGLGAIGLEASLQNAGSGTFTTADNAMVLTVAGVETAYSYCVAEDTLTVAPGTPNNAGMVTGSMAFEKQP
jgi:hypothetical protein